MHVAPSIMKVREHRCKTGRGEGGRRETEGEDVIAPFTMQDKPERVFSLSEYIVREYTGILIPGASSFVGVLSLR